MSDEDIVRFWPTINDLLGLTVMSSTHKMTTWVITIILPVRNLYTWTNQEVLKALNNESFKSGRMNSLLIYFRSTKTFTRQLSLHDNFVLEFILSCNETRYKSNQNKHKCKQSNFPAQWEYNLI
jgi:hypothetical protein